MTKLLFRSPEVAATVDRTTIFTGDGFTVDAACYAGGTDLILVSSKPGGSIFAVADDGTSAEADVEDGKLDADDEFDLLPGANGDSTIGRFQYEGPDGYVASGTFASDRIGDSCSITGHVISG